MWLALRFAICDAWACAACEVKSLSFLKLLWGLWFVGFVVCEVCAYDWIFPLCLCYAKHLSAACDLGQSNCAANILMAKISPAGNSLCLILALVLGLSQAWP